MQPRILINALHTVTGGGLTYLNGILPELVRDERFEWVLLLNPDAVGKVKVPLKMEVKVAPHLSFATGHLYEQLVLPVLCRLWRVKAVLCNANYVPLLAPRPMPIIHTTPRAAGHAQSAGMRLYWKVLAWLTRVSVIRAPVAFSVANHVIADYAAPRVAGKVRVAHPAVAPVAAGAPSAREADMVLTVGDFYPQKNYPLLLRAFKVLRERRPASRLVIVGRPVDGRVRDEVLALIRELDLSGSVTLTGAVPHDALLNTLHRAAVYVNASGAECFNIPVLEALVCGAPCVLPDADFQREVAGDAAVYVPVEKGGDVASAFAVAMFGVLENGSLADGLRRAAQRRAADFSWEKTAEVLREGVASTVLK